MRLALSLLVLLTTACALPPPDPEVVARACEDRARAAIAPQGTVTVGLNSERGPYTELGLSISGDYLAGRDPVAVYDECYYQRTGALPHRPPRLN